jgi:SAM-dependent methyltransferase
MFALAVSRGVIDFTGKRVLHFAADGCVASQVTKFSGVVHETADLQGAASRLLDIERMDLPNEQYDCVICSHVLEHVDDRKAIPEILRVLKAGGTMIAMIPIIEGWPSTYENASILSERDRERHFGQADHLRYYGADFRTRLKDAGFIVTEFTPGGVACADHGLVRGEKIFIAAKPAGVVTPG